jgi:hypothetical protein
MLGRCVNITHKEHGAEPVSFAFFGDCIEGDPRLRRTDMVPTIPRKIAEHVARLFDLAVLEHPVQLSSISMMTYWHPNNDSDPAHLWMRQRISELGPRLTRRPSPPLR